MLVASALFCHAPIVIPSIAGERLPRVRRTTEAMSEAAEWLLQSKPDRVLVLSPHAPRLPESFSVSSGQEVAGSFADFGHPEINMRFPLAATFGGAMCATSQTPGLNVLPLTHRGLDHGAAVPLYFLREAGWHGPVLVIGFPYTPSHGQCRDLGMLLKDVCMGVGGRTAICASGDMSHSLAEDSPCGFNPAGKLFDEYIVDKVKAGDIEAAVRVDEDLRDSAAEDIVDSLEIAGAAMDFSNDESEFLSYEGPFGVGYMVAKLYRSANGV